MPLPHGDLKLSSVVMQFHHKKEVDLRQKGHPHQYSTEFAVKLVTVQGCSHCVKFTSRAGEGNPD